MQLEAIPPSPITSHPREEADPQLTTTSLQVVKESKISFKPQLRLYISRKMLAI